MSELEEMIQTQEKKDLSSPEELEVIKVEKTPLSDNRLKELEEIVDLRIDGATKNQAVAVVSASLTGIFTCVMIASYILGKDVVAAESMLVTIIGILTTAISSLEYSSWKGSLRRAEEEFERLKVKLDKQAQDNQVQDNQVVTEEDGKVK